MLNCSGQMNIAASTRRDFVDSDMNDLTNFLNIFDRENGDGDPSIHYPKLTGSVFDRFRFRVVLLSLINRFRNAYEN